MKLKFLALSLVMIAGVNMVNAQSSTKDFVSEDRKTRHTPVSKRRTDTR